ncbi:MAG: VWA domain-containing protein [Terriglobia bacterium]
MNPDLIKPMGDTKRNSFLPGMIAACAIMAACVSAAAASPQARASSTQRASVSTSTPRVPPPDPADSTLKALSSIHVLSTLVQAPVTVTDSQGNYVQDLNESDFEILDDGVPQRITRFGLATQPISLVILVQTNQTVEPLLGQVRPLGSVFSGLFLGDKGQAAVVCFDSSVRVLQNFTSDPNALSQALQKIAAGGTRAILNDGLARAILMLSREPSTDRRVILVFSEGFNRGSETGRDEIIRAATAAGIAIYGVRFEPVNALLHNKQPAPAPSPIDDNMGRPGVPGHPQTPGSVQSYWDTPIDGLPLITDSLNVVRSARRRDLVAAYADYTGGVALGNWKQGALQGQLQRIALDVNSQYMLAYVPSTLHQTGFHRLRVVVREPGLKVRARAGYFYLTATTKKK